MIILKAKTVANEWVEFDVRRTSFDTRHPYVVTESGVVFIDLDTVELVSCTSTPNQRYNIPKHCKGQAMAKKKAKKKPVKIAAPSGVRNNKPKRSKSVKRA